MSKQKNKLKRHLSLIDIILFGIGGIVGAGIYAIIGEAAGLAGNLLWLSFLIAALVALLTGLAYAEFVSRFPDAGGSFEYVKQGVNPKVALVLSFFMFFTGIVSPAAIAISFSDYLGRLWEIPSWIAVVGIIILMGGINAIGVQKSSWFNAFATIITLLGLSAVVGFSFSEWGTTDLLNFEDANWVGLCSGSALIFFSYVGFEDLVKLAEETKEPRKNMPKGIIISAIAVTIIYVLIAISATSVLDANQLSKSQGPLAEVMQTVAGKSWATGLIVIALFATSKTIMANILSSSRLIFDVARDNDISFLNKLAAVHKDSGTPRIALVVVTLITIAFGLIGNLKVVASISNVFVFVVFLSVNYALIKYRLKEKNNTKEEPYFKMPLNIGKVSILSYIAIAGLLVLLGFNFYTIFIS